MRHSFIRHFAQKASPKHKVLPAFFVQKHEQIWKEIRKIGFKNEPFDSLDDVVDRLCDTICLITNDIIKSITGRNWILQCF